MFMDIHKQEIGGSIQYIGHVMKVLKHHMEYSIWFTLDYVPPL